MTYKTVTIEDLYHGGKTSVEDLYVYTTANNPDGAGEWTHARYIGTADNYTHAADLWDAACAVADVIYGKGGYAEIGLCIKIEGE